MSKRRCARSSLEKEEKKKKTTFCEDDFEAIDIAQKQDLAPGPRTREEIIQWPVDIVMRARQAGERFDNMIDLLKYGFLSTTDYSGYDCPRELVTQCFAALAFTHSWPPGYTPAVHFTRACDNDGLPLKVLSYLADVVDRAESCVQTDIENSLVADAIRALDKMIPHQEKDRLSKEEESEVQDSYKQMLHWLIDNRNWVFKEHCASECIIHDQECPGHPRQHEDCDGALRVNWAGTECVGWSTVGKQLRYAHRSERTHAIWMTQRIIHAENGKEDGVFQDGCFTSMFLFEFVFNLQLIDSLGVHPLLSDCK